MLTKDNEFKIFMPDVNLIKGLKDKAGKKRLIIEGVACTLDEDVDGEVLDPNGFDLNYFLTNGFINWHHSTKDNPQTIIGEPISCKIVNNEWIVKAELYNWNPLAQSVYSIMEDLKKNNATRKIGWSLEGAALAKDPLNQKLITKALITGLAITPMPKNKATWADISKGIGYEFQKGKNANGGTYEYIFETIKDNGDKVIVDKEFNVRIEKAMTTTSAVALIPSSFGKKHKDLVILKKAHENGSISDIQFKKIVNLVQKNLGI